MLSLQAQRHVGPRLRRTVQAGRPPRSLILPNTPTMRLSSPRLLTAAAFLATLGAPALLAGCDAADAGNPLDTAAAVTANGGLPEVTLTGSISGTRSLSNDSLYVLNGIVQVLGGALIQIEAGTRIEGSTNQPSALLIRQGGTIDAQGTQLNPIVFTSRNPVGTRAPGDWGGVIIIGRSTCNGAQFNDCDVEGLPAPLDNLTYGGNPVDENDDSGTLRYVRIEFAGFELTPANEINGLTLYSVGRGTSIEYVQVHKGSDDGVELFGGTVDLKRILVTGAQDDSFDYSYGWNGRLQFLAILQDEAAGDRGFEVDNNEVGDGSPNYYNRPLTAPTIYNYTVVGRFPSAQGSPNIGLYVRRGGAGKFRNGILGGFGSYNIDFDNPDDGTTATFDNCQTDSDTDELRVAGVIAALAGIAPLDPDSDNELQCIKESSYSASDPRLRNPINRQNPDFTPRNASLVTRANLVQAVPADGFFEPAAYLGAIAPNTPPTQLFYFGWSSFPAN